MLPSVSTSISEQVLSKEHPLVHALLAPVQIRAHRTIKVLDLNIWGKFAVAGNSEIVTFEPDLVTFFNFCQFLVVLAVLHVLKKFLSRLSSFI